MNTIEILERANELLGAELAGKDGPEHTDYRKDIETAMYVVWSMRTGAVRGGQHCGS